ncbi:putative pentatricopeptide repeat-containing protein-like [Capsicum annuum]|nr:putative pentatricopeptide repeat-containing protein-like [Capsicum annuum]
MVKSKIIKKLLKAQYLHQLIPNSKKRSHSNSITSAIDDQFRDETTRGETSLVPNDVKEGYFAVFSVNPEEEPTRFVVELHWLTHPSFLELLKKAEDEYGFRYEGVLEFPCRAEELEKVLATECSNKVSRW